MANGNFKGGTGFSADPYLIEDLADLCKLYSWKTGHTKVTYYKLVNDIDASKEELAKLSLTTWTPIPGVANGEGGKCIGGIDFDFKKIKNLYINKPGVNNVGFFESTSIYGGVGIIKRLRIEDAVVSGENNVGIYCGNFNASVTIDGMFVSGKVNGNTGVGGLIGNVSSYSAIITNCLADINVVGYDSVGGLIGICACNSSSAGGGVTNCITKGSVEGVTKVGGIAGVATITSPYVSLVKCVSLCKEIIRKSGVSTYFGRVEGHKGSPTNAANSKALKDMLFKY